MMTADFANVQQDVTDAHRRTENNLMSFRTWFALAMLLRQRLEFLSRQFSTIVKKIL